MERNHSEAINSIGVLGYWGVGLLGFQDDTIDTIHCVIEWK